MCQKDSVTGLSEELCQCDRDKCDRGTVCNRGTV